MHNYNRSNHTDNHVISFELSQQSHTVVNSLSHKERNIHKFVLTDRMGRRKVKREEVKNERIKVLEVKNKHKFKSGRGKKVGEKK